MSLHPSVPATVANLDLALVVEALARHACNVSDTAADLKVSAADLRRLLWAKPQLQNQASEVVEARLDTAEKNIAEALNSDDSRRRDAASFFVVRNSARSKRRGWITSASAGVEVNVQSNESIVFQWRTTPLEVSDPEELARRRVIDDAREALALAEGKRVVSIGWGNSDDGKTIEGDPVESDWAPPVYVSGSRDDVDGSAAGETEVAPPSVLQAPLAVRSLA